MKTGRISAKGPIEINKSICEFKACMDVLFRAPMVAIIVILIKNNYFLTATNWN